MQAMILIVGLIVANFARFAWFAAGVFLAVHALRFLGAL
jgi:hypothetical protein